MVNPYLCYAIAFSVALGTYALGWSTLYPPLSRGLLFFLLGTIALHGMAGVRFKSLFAPAEKQHPTGRPITVTIAIYILWVAEFLYEGGIPLFKILFNEPYNYRLFGIPTLHVFAVTFASFYTVYLFHRYLLARQRLVLVLFLVNLSAAILIYSRAMFFFNLSGCLFLYLMTRNKIPRFLPLIAAGSLVILFYLFGVMGTLRVSREAGTSYNNQHFLEIGKATPAFRDSAIPKEYFWTYIYMSSPLANLQTNISHYPVEPPSVHSAAEMVNNEVLMDFISKRVNVLLGIERRGEITVPGPFNVSTVYSRCFSYLGWYGMITMAIIVLLIPLVYVKVIHSNSPFFLTGFATLCTLFLFLAYDNTIRLTGLSFQLAYPIILHYGCKRLPRLRKIFL